MSLTIWEVLEILGTMIQTFPNREQISESGFHRLMEMKGMIQ